MFSRETVNETGSDAWRSIREVPLVIATTSFLERSAASGESTRPGHAVMAASLSPLLRFPALPRLIAILQHRLYKLEYGGPPFDPFVFGHEGKVESSIRPPIQVNRLL